MKHIIVPQSVRALVACAAAATLSSCKSDAPVVPSGPVVPTIGPPARVVVAPGDTTIDVGADVPLRVSVFDAAGNAITSASISATSDRPDVASVGAPASVSANYVGKATITVSAGSANATARISVKPQFVLVPFPGGANSAALTGINDAGVGVGISYVDGSSRRAFRYTTAGVSEYLGGSFYASGAQGVNAAGTAVGWAQVTPNVSNLATWSPAGVVQTYGDFGFTSGTEGYGINSNGQIVTTLGSGFSHPGLFDIASKKMTDLFATAPAGYGGPIGISDAGVVLGTGALPGSLYSGFTWSPQTGPRTIPLSDGRLVTPGGISPNGTIAGFAGIVGGGVQSVVIAANGQIKLMPHFGDTLDILPSGVSDRSDVVGMSHTNFAWPAHGMYWNESVGAIDLSAPIARKTYVAGISPNGFTVFGSVDDTPAIGNGGGFNQRPCLWTLKRR